MISRRSGASALALATALLVGIGAPVTPVGAQAAGDCVVTPADQAIDSLEYELMTLINNYRVQNGRPPLPLHPDLNRAAAWFARDMATKNYFPPLHVDSNGRDIPTRFTWCGVEFNAWRENIAAHTDGLPSTIFTGWRDSPTHNTNMLATDVTVMGLGHAFNAAAEFDHYWVQTLSDSKRIPVTNFDNDLDNEVSVFRPSGGVWYVGGNNPSSVVFGQNGDIPVPGDYDDDGDTDPAVFRPSNGVWYTRSPLQSLPFGANGDIPVPADYTGDGRFEIAVYRPSNNVWYIQNPASSTLFGATGDIPVPGDYDGDGKAEIAVFRPSTGVWYSQGAAPAAVPFGANGDIPVPGDYDGDGSTDQAVFRPSTGVWYINRLPAPVSVPFGVSGDVPVPADYDSDGKTDIAVFRPSTGVWYLNNSFAAPASVVFGQSTDIPLPLPHAIRRSFFS